MALPPSFVGEEAPRIGETLVAMAGLASFVPSRGPEKVNVQPAHGTWLSLFSVSVLMFLVFGIASVGQLTSGDWGWPASYIILGIALLAGFGLWFSFGHMQMRVQFKATKVVVVDSRARKRSVPLGDLASFASHSERLVIVLRNGPPVILKEREYDAVHRGAVANALRARGVSEVAPAT